MTQRTLDSPSRVTPALMVFPKGLANVIYLVAAAKNLGDTLDSSLPLAPYSQSFRQQFLSALSSKDVLNGSSLEHPRPGHLHLLPGSMD